MSNSPIQPRQPRYSGPNRSGICICGHSWNEHHLCCVMRQEYIDETGEGYLPDECCHYGSNEVGGMKYDDEAGEWVDHCRGYKDSKDI